MYFGEPRALDIVSLPIALCSHQHSYSTQNLSKTQESSSYRCVEAARCKSAPRRHCESARGGRGNLKNTKPVPAKAGILKTEGHRKSLLAANHQCS